MREVPTYPRIIAVILILGFLIGGWRSWKSWHDGRPLAGSGEGIAQIELLTTQDKDNWVRSQVYLFNDENFKQYHVIAQYQDSRAAMESLIHNKARPILWSPDSPIWISRAAAVWPGGKLVDIDDPGSFRVFLRSPVVFLTTRDKADFLRSRLGGQHPWAAIHDLATGKTRAPWGKARFRHADPLTSNSGMLALGMMLAEYARDHAPLQSITDVAQSPGFGQFLSETEGALVYDPACAQGSAAVAREYADAPQGCDFIVTYENLALAAAKEHPNLVAIYPNPTMVAEQSLCVLNANWVSPQQRAGAEAFMTFVSRARALQDGLKYDMRPAIQGSDSLLDPVLLQYRERGFQQMFDQESTPPYDALNAAAVQWNTRVKR